MPKPAITATTTHQVTITPTLRRKLVTELKTWDQLHTQEKAIKAAKAKHAANIEAIQTELEESTLKIEGFTTTIVAPVRSKIDRERFVKLGGKLDILDAATVQTPGKSYVKITPPGSGRGGDDE